MEAGLERSRTTMADGRCMHHSRGVEPEAMHAAWHAWALPRSPYHCMRNSHQAHEPKLSFFF